MGTGFFLPGGKSPSTAGSRTESAKAQQLLMESSGTQENLLANMMAALFGGGQGMPELARAKAASDQTTRQVMKTTEEQLQTAGLANSPFAPRIREEARISGESAKLGISNQIVQDFISMIPGFTGSMDATAMSGFSAATGSEAAIRAQQIAAVAQIMAASMGGGSSMGAGGGMGGMGGGGMGGAGGGGGGA